MENVYEYLVKKIKQDGAIHLTLLDPDEQTPEKTAEMAAKAVEAGSSGIMMGGSGGDHTSIDRCIKAIKKKTQVPVILFPGNVTDISPEADAIFFMSLLNSRSRYWLAMAQAFGAFAVKQYNLEAISMGYIVIECGKKTSVEFYGDANTIPREKPKIAAAFALAAQYMGMKLVYLEGGSGAENPVPIELVQTVKNTVDIPIIVGGGLRTGKSAAERVKAGASIIVTGTVGEQTSDIYKKTKEIVDAIKKAK